MVPMNLFAWQHGEKTDEPGGGAGEGEIYGE